MCEKPQVHRCRKSLKESNFIVNSILNDILGGSGSGIAHPPRENGIVHLVELLFLTI
jgi:hypothetical protein